MQEGPAGSTGSVKLEAGSPLEHLELSVGKPRQETDCAGGMWSLPLTRFMPPRGVPLAAFFNAQAAPGSTTVLVAMLRPTLEKKASGPVLIRVWANCVGAGRHVQVLSPANEAVNFGSTVLSRVRGANLTSLNSFLSSFLFPSVSKAAIAA